MDGSREQAGAGNRPGGPDRNYRVIDKETYYRRGVFRHFSEDCKCSVSVTARVDVTALARMGVRADFAPVADFAHGLVRHDPMALARAIMDLYHRISPTRIY